MGQELEGGSKTWPKGLGRGSQHGARVPPWENELGEASETQKTSSPGSFSFVHFVACSLVLLDSSSISRFRDRILGRDVAPESEQSSWIKKENELDQEPLT